MLLRKGNDWIAFGLLRTGRDRIGEFYRVVSRQFMAGATTLPPAHIYTEKMSKEGASREGLRIATAFQNNGWAVDTAELWRDAFKGSVDPLAGLEPLPVKQIQEAIKKDRLSRAIEAKRQEKLKEALVEAAVAEAKAREAKNKKEEEESRSAAEFQRTRYERMRQESEERARQREPGFVELPSQPLPAPPTPTPAPIVVPDGVDADQYIRGKTLELD